MRGGGGRVLDQLYYRYSIKKNSKNSLFIKDLLSQVKKNNKYALMNVIFTLDCSTYYFPES